MLCISKLPCVPQQPQSAGEHIGAGTHLAASPLPSPCQGGSLKSEAAAVPRHPGQSGHQIISTLPSAQHLHPEFHQPYEARSKIPEAREEKELPAALHGLTARLQPSSLQAPPVPQAHYNCSVPVVFSGYTSSWAQCSCGRRKGIFFPPKPARTGQAVSSLKQPQQQEVKQLSSWKEKM